MIVIYVLLFIIVILTLLLLVPMRVKLKYAVNTNFNIEEDKEELNTLNYAEIYILYFIKIKKIKIGNKQSTGKREKVLGVIYKFLLDFLNFRKIDDALLRKGELKKIGDSIYIEKLNLDIGLNFQNIIANVYIIALLNSLINMYFAKKIDKMNTEDVQYSTYISDKIFNINLDSIIRFKLVNTITIIIKIIVRFRKVVSKNGKATSNRKLNDDSYEFA